jgi:hypothetical protein
MSLLLWWQSGGGGGPSFVVAWAELDELRVLYAMKRNVASQSIGVQMVNASDGTAFTGAVSVAVTKDNGAQAAGSGSAPAHEGNGYHSYTPTQAETDADHIAFTFTGSGAIPRTVQVYTTFPQTGDSFARLGAPAGASVSADILAIDNLVDDLESRLGVPVGASISADIADVEGKVDDLESRLGVPSNLGGGATIAANLADIEAQTDDIGAAGAGLTALGDARLANLDATVSSRATPAQVNAEVDAALDTAIPGVPTANSINERIKALDDNYTAARAPNLDNLDAAVSSRSSHSAADVWAVGTRALTDKVDFALTAAEKAAIVNALWDELTSEARTAGSFGQKIKDLLVDGSGRVTVGAMGPNTVDAAATSADFLSELVAAVLAGVIEGTVTLKQSLQLSNAAAASKLSGAATVTATLRNLADTMDRIVATVDADGNRTAVTRTFE